MKLLLPSFGKLFLIIFAVILFSAFYKGVITLPSEGDSVDYHIPIAASFLSGEFINPTNLDAPLHTRFYPGNGEMILSFFMFFGIPLGLYNFLGIIVLFVASVKIARSFNLEPNVSVIFAVSVSTLNGVLRWVDTQIIDIWLVAIFLLTISYLEKPKKSIRYFFVLGSLFGLLIGMKFSAPFIAGVLIIVYFRRLIHYISVQNIVAWLIPVILLGASWYIRNYLLIQNPLYPQAFLFFPGLQSTIIDVSVLNIITSSRDGLLGTINAFISEFVVWAAIVPIVIISVLRKKLQNHAFDFPLRILLIGFLVGALVINLPSSLETNIMTSSFRYFHPAIVPLILSAFIYFQKSDKIIVLFIPSFVSILLVEYPLGYYPKLVFLLVPICLFIYFSGYDFLISKLKKV